MSSVVASCEREFRPWWRLVLPGSEHLFDGVDELRRLASRNSACSAWVTPVFEGQATWNATENSDDLLNRADIAKYAAKRRREGRQRAAAGFSDR